MATWVFGDTRYHLTEDQAAEIVKQDNAITDDDEFARWLNTYVRKESIKTEEIKRARYWSRLPDYTPTDAPGKATLMAAALQAMTTLVKVVDPSIERGNVKFNDKVNTSSTDGANVTLPVKYAKEAKTVHEAIDATAGFAIHEAFHNKFSGKIIKDYDFRYAVDQDKGLKTIWNILEDARINRLGLIDNPGFEDYIDGVYNLMVKEANGWTPPQHFPKDFNQQVSAVFSHLMLPKVFGDGEDKDYANVIRKVRTTMQNYAERDDVGAREAIDVAKKVRQLFDMNPPDDQNPEPMPTSFHAAGDSDGDEYDPFSQQDQVAATANALASMDMQMAGKGEFVTPKAGDYAPNIMTVKPIEKPRNNIMKGLNDEARRAEAMLRVKRTRDLNIERESRNGELDEDEAFRVLNPISDMRVFKNTVENVDEQAVVYFLIDNSGSMDGRIGNTMGLTKMQIAAQMAWIVVKSMLKKPHVEVKVFSHTGDTRVTGVSTITHDGAIVYRIWEPGDDIDRLNLIPQLASGNNYDGWIIELLGKKILSEPAHTKYLIVLSDGLPSGTGCGQLNAREHVRVVSDSLIRKGVNVMQIAIDPSLKSEHQAEMYKHFVMFRNINETIRQFAKLLDKVR